MKGKRTGDGEKFSARTLWEPAVFLAPFLIGLVLFTVYPFINVFIISFKENYKLLTGEFTAIGLENYRAVISDPNFLNGLKNTALYAVFVVPAATVLSLLIATFLNGEIRLKGLFQTCYFLPMVTSVTAVGLVWKWLYNYDYGFVRADFFPHYAAAFGADDRADADYQHDFRVQGVFGAVPAL